MRRVDACSAPVFATLEENISLTQLLLRDGSYIDGVVATARVLVEALRASNRIYAFGNGGSAADAEHFAAELAGRMAIDHPSLPCLALTSNSALLTALANDYGYEHVFGRQIVGLGKPGDIAFGISTSGNSPNVLEAIKVAREHGLTTIGLTGRGGELPSLVDHCICIPSDATPRIQEAHMLTIHVLCDLVERCLFGDEQPAPGSGNDVCVASK